MATAFGHLVSPDGQLLAKGKNPIQNCFGEMTDVVIAGIQRDDSQSQLSHALLHHCRRLLTDWGQKLRRPGLKKIANTFRTCVVECCLHRKLASSRHVPHYHLHHSDGALIGSKGHVD
ncbi:MAG: hypothetical protein AB2809_18220 [Candidatus Thiodiazotropha sp.]